MCAAWINSKLTRGTRGICLPLLPKSRPKDKIKTKLKAIKWENAAASEQEMQETRNLGDNL